MTAPTRLLTSREVAVLSGLTIWRIRQLAPAMAEKYEVFAGQWMYHWDDEAIKRLQGRRKSPGSGKRKESK